MEDNIVHVALGKNVKEYKPILAWAVWALKNSGGKTICVIHVHQPAKMIPMMGAKFPANTMKERELRAYRELERQKMQKILDEYLLICRQMGVQAESRHIEMESIEEGIVELVCQLGIRKLVMGTAAYSKRTMDIKSKKARYVRLQASKSCRIQFICKGRLVHTREGILDGADVEVRPNQNCKTEPSNYGRSQSAGQNIGAAPTSLAQVSFCSERNASIYYSVGSGTDISSLDCTEEFSTPRSRSVTEGSSDEWFESSRRYPPSLDYSKCSASRSVDIARISSVRSEGSELSTFPQSIESPYCLSPPSLLDGSVDETLYAQLEKAMAEAEHARREAFQEAERRAKVEKNAIEAKRRAQVLESLCAEELKQRKEIEEALAKEKEEHEKVKIQLNKVMGDLQVALDKKSSLECKIAESDEMVEELELSIASVMQLLQTCEKERDEFLVGRDNAIKEAEELRRKKVESSSTRMPQFSEFSYLEIDKATQNFDPFLEIGEGRHGNTYKGILREIQVAIKVPHQRNLQDPLGFQSEVDTLNKLRHPNLVTLIGYCQEVQALIYEYLPNGSLEDRLSCKDNTPPLSWQIRICIATELCSALIFLHSCKPFSVLHGDLTPAKVLLDANFVSKLCDFGRCRLLSHDLSSNNLTLRWKTELKDTSFAYLDPQFHSTGELTLESDVYSFGITLLQLLTGRPPRGLKKEVKYALDAGKLEDLLDPLAGDWPFEQAKQLAHLALSCSEIYRENRLDLALDVWPVLEPMREDLCGDSSSLQLSTKEHSEPPSYFLCPISQDVMQNPHVATDGFTYEEKFLSEWFDGGHDTSPMTNLKLEHCNLVPNYALRSAIQEWQQKH
ncbi:U-box domain-containing protein 33-like isoform X4 [Quercus robur]|uniref:U-box domain-containing protein 33-like isoform X4 n=1 Tax=Quercus robur TaxID=38942 RepID=UPI002163D2B6|nr:U-box domain-containing protein 33-like isoform X4 [Quercus robur]